MQRILADAQVEGGLAVRDVEQRFDAGNRREKARHGAQVLEGDRDPVSGAEWVGGGIIRDLSRRVSCVSIYEKRQGTLPQRL